MRGKMQYGTYRMYLPCPSDQGKGSDELLVAKLRYLTLPYQLGTDELAGSPRSSASE